MGFDIRPAQIADGEAVWRVRSASWEQAYSGFLPSTLWDADAGVGFIERWPGWIGRADLFAVCRINGVIEGYVATKIDHEDDTEPSPYMVQALYVHPSAQRLGLGRAMMAHAVEDFIQRGATTIGIAAFAVNSRARDIYRHWGGISTGLGTYEVLGTPYPDERFRFDDPQALLRKLKQEA